MKKCILLLGLSILFIPSAFCETLDSTDWYQYNGYSTIHSFSVKYPTDWQVRTFGDDLQGFAPKGVYEDIYYLIQEFEGETYDQAINTYVNENTDLLETKDFILSNNNDLVAKRAIYLNISEGKKSAITFIKRGSLIVAITEPNLEENPAYPNPEKYNDIIETIYSSFAFSGEWYQYIDFGENYTFIFPSSLEINNISDGVMISNPSQFDSEIFSVLKYENTPLSSAPAFAEGYSEELVDQKDIFFHGIDRAIYATYYNNEDDKSFSRIFVENGGNSYGMTNINIESNYPHLNYYDDYLVEVLESFEFFDIEGAFYTFANFPDVRDNHPNADAINYLTELDIIDGYPDGTFQPDGEINRAELTKLIVASVVDPDKEKYKNCFPDVEEEWFAPYICYAKEKEWVAGYPDGYFRPGKNINRVETLKIILEVLFEEINEDEELINTAVADVSVDDWYSKYFIFAENRKLLDKQHIIEEDGQYFYYPDKNATRKEVAEIIYRSLKIQ